MLGLLLDSLKEKELSTPTCSVAFKNLAVGPGVASPWFKSSAHGRERPFGVGFLICFTTSIYLT